MNPSTDNTALRDRALVTVSCEQWAGQMGWTLRRSGSSELFGPCPVCGGKDRFSINTIKNVWNCRGCDKGGDVIALVMHTENLAFLDSCERITGERRAKPISAEEQARLDEQRRLAQERRDREAEQYRENARRDARAIWEKAWPVAEVRQDVVADYFRIRGLAGGAIDFADRGWARDLGLPLRCNLLGYWHDGKKLGDAPVMIAPIQFPDGHFAGVHLTYLDLNQPKGKVVLTDQKGEELPAKKVRGVHKGCAIRLLTPAGATRLVMGEGIETTMTAVAHAREPGTAYWAGVALGNMAGKAARKPAGGWLHDQPDMDDRDCFLPPDWVEELVYLCDGDEPRKHTVEKVQRGLRRARRLRERARLADPSLRPLSIKWVPPGAAGTDLNDLAMTDDETDEGEPRAVSRDGRPDNSGAAA